MTFNSYASSGKIVSCSKLCVYNVKSITHYVSVTSPTSVFESKRFIAINTSTEFSGLKYWEGHALWEKWLQCYGRIVRLKNFDAWPSLSALLYLLYLNVLIMIKNETLIYDSQCSKFFYRKEFNVFTILYCYWMRNFFMLVVGQLLAKFLKICICCITGDSYYSRQAFRQSRPDSTSGKPDVVISKKLDSGCL